MEHKCVDILLRNASTRYEDFLITGMSVELNISQLKTVISERYPPKPVVEQIKLVFAGSLLQDTQTLAQIFSQQDLTKVQNVHIVISQTRERADSNNEARNRVGGQQQELRNRHPERREGQQREREEQQEAPFQNVAEVPAGEEREEERSSLWTLIKLIFVVFIFSQGGGGPRLFILCFAAAIIFL